MQVGRNADDSEIIELHSGDILQFGVDVTENSKKGLPKLSDIWIYKYTLYIYCTLYITT